MAGIVRRKKRKTFYYALYVRKSTEEVDSRSVKNQLEVLETEKERIIKNDPDNDYISVGNFVDEDYSGTDSQRPDFMRMLRMIGEKKINMVMVTDLSRLSRNTSESLNYVQGMFVALDVRFYSYQLPSLDSYLNPEGIYNIQVSFQSMMNENHCAETSMKIRRTFKMMRERGKFIGAFAGYGWKKSEKDKHVLELDEEAYNVLHMMKEMLFSGMSRNAVALNLNKLGIPNPTLYKQQKGFNYMNNRINSGLWSGNVVKNILTRPENTGNLVQGRYRVKSYKVHTQIRVPEEEWTVCKNAIPAIFTEEEQERIVDCLERISRSRNSKDKDEKVENIFAGRIFCGECGATMNTKGLGSSSRTYYVCNKYKNYKVCTKHSMRFDRLSEIVLSSTRQMIGNIIEMKEVIDILDNSPVIEQRVKELEEIARKHKNELEKIGRYKKDLYKDWKDEIISRMEYREMKEEYLEREEELHEKINNIEKEIEKTSHTKKHGSKLIEEFKNYGNIQKLDRSLICTLIDKIYVYGDRRVEIRFRFQDEYERMNELLQNAQKLLESNVA